MNKQSQMATLTVIVILVTLAFSSEFTAMAKQITNGEAIIALLALLILVIGVVRWLRYER